jgi:hypothetical protein
MTLSNDSDFKYRKTDNVKKTVYVSKQATYFKGIHFNNLPIGRQYECFIINEI